MDFELLSLPIYEHTMEEFISKETYYEFCHVVDDLSAALQSYDFFNEDVIDPGDNRRTKMRNILSNTASTTKGIAKVFDDVTDAKGAMLKPEVDLVIKAAKLAAKAFKFVVRNLSKIPNGISDLIDMATKVPGIVRAKIKGNIMLYFTARDIQAVYNAAIIRRLEEFVNTANKLCKGDTWTTFWTNYQKGLKLNFDKSDMDLCRRLIQYNKDLNALEFEKTEIKMDNLNNVDMYLNPKNQAIKFTDIHGHRHECSYLEALRQLSLDLESMKTNIEGLETTFGAKYDESVLNENFTNLSKNSQNLIYDTMKSISSVIRLIGLIMVRVTADVNTIEKALVKCRNQRVKAVAKDAQQAGQASDQSNQ